MVRLSSAKNAHKRKCLASEFYNLSSFGCRVDRSDFAHCCRLPCHIVTVCASSQKGEKYVLRNKLTI